MEIESEAGDRIPIESGAAAEIGRLESRRASSSSSSSAATGAGDRTVSRRHLSLCLDGVGNEEPHAEPTVSFEVVGRNPVFVCFGGGRGTKVYRSSEKGELRDGDRFSLSLKSPSFWAVRRRESGKDAVDRRVLDAVERRERRTQERRKEKEKEKSRQVKVEAGEDGGDLEAGNGELEVELGSVDISGIDPVKEFGFLVKGHEFDSYPRHRVRPPKEWNWFLEVPGRRGDGEDEDGDEEMSNGRISLKRKSRVKRKCDDEEEEDDEWAGNSEDGTGNVGQIRSERKSKYETRSHGPKNPRKKELVDRRKTSNVDDDEEETLGGFIVDDEELEEEEADEEEDEFEEEEEEEEEEEDDDDDDDD